MAKGKYQQWLDPDGLILIRGWARDGLGYDQIAKKMEISRSTLMEWRKTYPDISDALKRSREVSDYEAEDTLEKRIRGYTVVESTTTLDDNGEVIGVVQREKHIPPDTTALIFYLKNRMPKKWKDKPIDEADEDALKKLREILGAIPSAF